MRTRTLLLGGALALCAAQVQAQLYVGAGFGRSEVDEDVVLGLIDSGSVDATDTGFKVFGGYRINPWFAIESAYVDLGETTYSGTFGPDPVANGRIEIGGATLGPVVFVPVTPAFEVFGKLGLFVWEAEARDITAGTRFSSTEDGTDVFFGAGLSYAFTPNLVARAEWEQFEIEEVDASLLSLGLLFRF